MHVDRTGKRPGLAPSLTMLAAGLTACGSDGHGQPPTLDPNTAMARCQALAGKRIDPGLADVSAVAAAAFMTRAGAAIPDVPACCGMQATPRLSSDSGIRIPLALRSTGSCQSQGHWQRRTFSGRNVARLTDGLMKTE